MSISKSRYTAFCQCPKNLWLEIHHPEYAAEVDPMTQARFNNGTEVGKLAQKLFPGTVDVTTLNPDGSQNHAKMIEKTRRRMDDGTPVIAEAAFSHGGCYCAVDLLRREGDGWAIYEVKSSTTKEEDGKKAKLNKYLPDIAYQTWLLRQCKVKVTGINLVDEDEGEQLSLFAAGEQTSLFSDNTSDVSSNLIISVIISASFLWFKDFYQVVQSMIRYFYNPNIWIDCRKWIIGCFNLCVCNCVK